MPESITQADQDYSENAVQLDHTEENIVASSEASPALSSEATLVIWTPGFILLFAAILVVGLSDASMLTQGMVNGGLYPAGAVLCGYSIVLLGFWIALIRSTHSFWLHVGGIFGCVWSVFASIGFILSTLPLAPTAPILVHLSVATDSAFLAAFTCLSVARTPFRHWDSWFFALALPFAACVVALIYTFLPAPWHTISSLETVVALTLLGLGTLTWWLRPSCWRVQPGPTFLLGVAPLLQVLVAIPGLPTPGDQLFFSQVALLMLLLGILRLIQSERRLQVSRAG